MQKSKSFRFLLFTTYATPFLLAIMVIFAFMGKFLGIGWLESAPDVLMIPALLAYYISLIMGAIYGYLKGEKAVYLFSLIAIGAWIIGMLISAMAPFSQQAMMFINIVFIAGFLVLFLFQLKATRNWENRVMGDS